MLNQFYWHVFQESDQQHWAASSSAAEASRPAAEPVFCYGLGDSLPSVPFLLQLNPSDSDRASLSGSHVVRIGQALRGGGGGDASEPAAARDGKDKRRGAATKEHKQPTLRQLVNYLPGRYARRRDAMRHLIAAYMAENVQYDVVLRRHVCRLDGQQFASESDAVAHVHANYRHAIVDTLRLFAAPCREQEHGAYFFTKLLYSDFVYADLLVEDAAAEAQRRAVQKLPADYPSALAPSFCLQHLPGSLLSPPPALSRDSAVTDAQLAAIEQQLFGVEAQQLLESLQRKPVSADTSLAVRDYVAQIDEKSLDISDLSPEDLTALIKYERERDLRDREARLFLFFHRQILQDEIDQALPAATIPAKSLALLDHRQRVRKASQEQLLQHLRLPIMELILNDVIKERCLSAIQHTLTELITQAGSNIVGGMIPISPSFSKKPSTPIDTQKQKSPSPASQSSTSTLSTSSQAQSTSISSPSTSSPSTSSPSQSTSIVSTVSSPPSTSQSTVSTPARAPSKAVKTTSLPPAASLKGTPIDNSSTATRKQASSTPPAASEQTTQAKSTGSSGQTAAPRASKAAGKPTTPSKAAAETGKSSTEHSAAASKAAAQQPPAAGKAPTEQPATAGKSPPPEHGKTSADSTAKTPSPDSSPDESGRSPPAVKPTAKAKPPAAAAKVVSAAPKPLPPVKATPAAATAPPKPAPAAAPPKAVPAAAPKPVPATVPPKAKPQPAGATKAGASPAKKPTKPAQAEPAVLPGGANSKAPATSPELKPTPTPTKIGSERDSGAALSIDAGADSAARRPFASQAIGDGATLWQSPPSPISKPPAHKSRPLESLVDETPGFGSSLFGGYPSFAMAEQLTPPGFADAPLPYAPLPAARSATDRWTTSEHARTVQPFADRPPGFPAIDARVESGRFGPLFGFESEPIRRPATNNSTPYYSTTTTTALPAHIARQSGFNPAKTIVCSRLHPNTTLFDLTSLFESAPLPNGTRSGPKRIEFVDMERLAADPSVDVARVGAFHPFALVEFASTEQAFAAGRLHGALVRGVPASIEPLSSPNPAPLPAFDEDDSLFSDRLPTFATQHEQPPAGWNSFRSFGDPAGLGFASLFSYSQQH